MEHDTNHTGRKREVVIDQAVRNPWPSQIQRTWIKRIKESSHLGPDFTLPIPISLQAQAMFAFVIIPT